MRSFRAGRAVSLVFTLAAALASAGCPELNRQPDRPVNPLFSIDDPAGRDAARGRSPSGAEFEAAEDIPPARF